MKPPKFHVGQAVVCVSDKWGAIFGEDEGNRKPKQNRVYTVAHMEYWRQINGYALSLAECAIEDGYNEVFFAPADEASDEALAELLEESFALPAHAVL